MAELSVDDLRTAYEWSRPQEEALHELERHYSAALPRRGPGPDEGAGAAPGGPAASGRREGLAWLAEFARLEDLAGFRDVELSARVALNTLQVLLSCALPLAEEQDPSSIVGSYPLYGLSGATGWINSPPLTAKQLKGKVVLVDVSGLGGTEEVLVASYLTRRVLEEWQGAFLSDPERHRQLPVVAVALEEAQRVLSANKDRESNVFPRVAREGRKFGVGLLAVTQQPKLLNLCRAPEPVQHFFRPGLSR